MQDSCAIIDICRTITVYGCTITTLLHNNERQNIYIGLTQPSRFLSYLNLSMCMYRQTYRNLYVIPVYCISWSKTEWKDKSKPTSSVRQVDVRIV